MNTSVFVTSIAKSNHGTIVVEASNGSPDGPPFVRFQLPTSEASSCTIGKRYFVIISECRIGDDE